MKSRCEECRQLKLELPFLYFYLDDSMHCTTERKTCYDCWKVLNRRHKVISSGPGTKRGKNKYERVTVVGAPLIYQQELF